ncbi:MAG: MATE family efflux transporter [Phocaeicola sp.]|nr:MATE family efflux transporter [Phocaeicola sp.]
MNSTNKAYSTKEILTVAYPILISLIMEHAIGMTDTAFLGRVGEIELGASAIAGVYYISIFMIGFGFSIGSQILMARRNGEKKFREIGDIFYQGVYFMIFLATVAFTLTKIITPWLMPKIISSQNIYLAAESYIDWRAYGFFFSFIGVMFRAFFVGTTQTKTLTLNSLVMVVSNVIFNYILIFGKFGFPALGIAGAAIGSSLAELVSLIFFIIYTIKRIDTKKYGLNRFSGISTVKLKKILGISLWTMIQNFISLSTWFIFFLYVEHLGERPLAITNIIRNISGITFMVIAAFASTCGSLVSNQIGAGKTESVITTVNQHIKLAFSIVLPLSVLFALFPRVVLGIYTDMPDLIEASIPALWVFCTTTILIAPSNIYFQAVSGTGNTRMAFILELCTLAIYAVYITVTILVMRVDVAWCWTSEHVYGLFLLLFCSIYLHKGKWRLKKI